jgi:hypothetical protein
MTPAAAFAPPNAAAPKKRLAFGSLFVLTTRIAQQTAATGMNHHRPTIAAGTKTVGITTRVMVVVFRRKHSALGQCSAMTAE